MFPSKLTQSRMGTFTKYSGLSNKYINEWNQLLSSGVHPARKRRVITLFRGFEHGATPGEIRSALVRIRIILDENRIRHSNFAIFSIFFRLICMVSG